MMVDHLTKTSYDPSLMDSAEHRFGRVYEALTKASRVLLVAHKKPDGDTLGSSSSVLNWLMREGKNVTVFCVDPVPPTFAYLDNAHRYTTDPAVFDRAYDVVIIFDSGDLRYCGVAEYVPRIPEGYLLVDIDHHVTNELYGHVNLVFTDASSTAEVVWRFYEANNIWIDPPMATSLMTGLLTDTSSFSNAATTSASMQAASTMVARGARLQDIAEHVVKNKTIPSLRIWGLALSRLVYNPRFDVVTTYILKDDLEGQTGDIIEGISNFLNAVVGNIDTILTLHELPNGDIKGSFRSVKRDISKLAKVLGGGGHKKAAGFTVKGRIDPRADGIRIIG